MVDNAVPTLAPQKPAANVPQSRPDPVKSPLNQNKESLLNSIALEGVEADENAEGSPYKGIFSALMWFGYTIAVIVALVLVWSAANGLLMSFR